MSLIVRFALTFVLSLLIHSSQAFTTPPYTVPYYYGGSTYTWIAQAQADSSNTYVFYCKESAGDPTIDFNSGTTFFLRFGGGYGWYESNYCILFYTSNGGSSWGSVSVNGYYYLGYPDYASFTTQFRSQREFKYNGYPSNGYSNVNFSVSNINQDERLIAASSIPKNFKMPLPGGKSWLLTVQNGGNIFCNGGTDSYHTGNGYYSLDFDDSSQQGGQGTNVPIYAAASGTIDTGDYGYDGSGYGHWVKVNHGNGYKTLYGHMTAETLITSGPVNQGDQLGTVGNTGNSFGSHLHLQFYYNGSSASTATELGSLLMEGLTLSQYAVGCPLYYGSTNTP